MGRQRLRPSSYQWCHYALTDGDIIILQGVLVATGATAVSPTAALKRKGLRSGDNAPVYAQEIICSKSSVTRAEVQRLDVCGWKACIGFRLRYSLSSVLMHNGSDVWLTGI
jgi:hypothetical protein